ncbi:MAG: hypothetical protein WAM96_07730 [Candidatus Acidiferrales bacterium]
MANCSGPWQLLETIVANRNRIGQLRKLRNRRSRNLFFVLGAAALGLAIVALAVIVLLPARRFSFRIRRKLVRLREAQRAMADRPQFVLAALLLALLVQGSFIALTAVLADAAGLHLAFQASLFA